MGRWFQFSCAAAIDAAVADEIPGVRVVGTQVAHAPENCAWLLETWLRSRDIGFSMAPLLVRARSVEIASLRQIPELREWVPDFLAPYQHELIRRALNATGYHAWHPAGSGKSISAICWGLSAPGLLLFVTRAGARGTIAGEFERYTTVRDIVIIEDEDVRPLGSPRVVIIGWENLPAWAKTLEAMKPTSIVGDELHKSKSHKRFEALVGESGDLKFKKRENIASASMDLFRSAARRLGTTASPIKDRMRDLWAQLDLIEPGQWGTYWQWSRRYCAAGPGIWGGLDDRGKATPEIMAELRQRTSFCAHAVPYSVTHRELPPKRRIVTYLKPEEQSAPSAFARELKTAVKHGAERLLETQLMQAASRKKRKVVDLVTEQLLSGGKVIVFTGRKEDARNLEEAIRKAAPAGATIWQATGDDSTRARDEIRKDYMACEKSACLVATGDSFGESYNLQDTDLLVLAMLPWNVGQLIQWEGRVSRKGQTRPVLVQYVIAEGTVDERVASLILEKLPAVEAVVGDDAATGMGEALLGDPEELKASLLSKVLGGANVNS